MTNQNNDDDFLPGIRGSQIEHDSGEASLSARHSTLHKATIGALILVILCCFVFILYEVIQIYAPKRPSPARFLPMMHTVFPPPPAAGEPTAKIKVIAVIPSTTTCQKETCELLRSIALKYPDKIRAEFYDLMASKGADVLSRHKASCSTILINGQYTFDLIGKEGQHEVILLSGAPSVEYQMTDIVRVIRLKLKEIYSAVPKDFDSFTSAKIKTLTNKQKERISKETAGRTHGQSKPSSMK